MSARISTSRSFACVTHYNMLLLLQYRLYSNFEQNLTTFTLTSPEKNGFIFVLRTDDS